MADPKYKIRVIQTGIGDPFFVGTFQFDYSQAGYTNPATTPLQNLTIAIAFKNDDGEWVAYGSITVNKPLSNWQSDDNDGTPTYHFGLPFDPGSEFTIGNTLHYKLTFTANNAQIILNDGSDNTSSHSMTFSSSTSVYPELHVYYAYPEID